MMRIGELARATGERVKTLRYWETQGLLEAERSASGYRYFPSGTIERVGFIRRAQALGFTLAEVRDILALRAEGVPPCEEVRSRLGEHLARVRSRLRDLRALEATLAQRLAWASTHPEPACEGECVYLAEDLAAHA